MMEFSKKLILCLVLLLCVGGIAHAAPPEVDPSRFETTTAGFQRFYLNLVPSVKKIVTNSSITDFSITLWKFFAVMLIIWQLTLYVLRGSDFSELFTVIFMVAITHVLMVQYDNITAALWSWSEAVATGIQTSAIGVSDAFFGPRYIWNLMTSFNWSAENFLFHPQNVVASIILAACGALICVLAFIATAWAMWGYSLAKIIGLMFLPTLLFERLSWLFDGWLRFFFGFLLYNIVAKTSLMLVLIALSTYFALPLDQVPQHIGYQFLINSFTDVLGLFVFLILSIIGLLFTGTFVRSLVAGSHTGSLTGGTKALHQGLTKLAGLIK